MDLIEFVTGAKNFKGIMSCFSRTVAELKDLVVRENKKVKKLSIKKSKISGKITNSEEEIARSEKAIETIEKLFGEL